MASSASTGEHGDLLHHVASARVDPGELALWYTGGAGYIIQTSRVTILIDPYVGPDHPPYWVRAIPPAFDPDRLDGVAAVLLTHEHDDHADPVALGAIGRRTSAPIFGPASAIDIAHSAGIPTDRCHAVTPDQTVEIGDLRLTAVPAHDPLAQECLGWVLETDAVTLLHCGDSLYFPGFLDLGRRWTIDAMCVSVGLNPPGTTFYMDESDAARAARDTGARILIPQHYDLWESTRIDPARVATVAQWYSPGIQVMPARFRQRITITKA
jgi:L-ascorbate 6-phosphate lactonase